MAKSIKRLKHTKLKRVRIKKGKHRGKIVHRWKGKKLKKKKKTKCHYLTKSEKERALKKMRKIRWEVYNEYYKPIYG